MATLITGLDMSTDAWSAAYGSGAHANVSYASGSLSTIGESVEPRMRRFKHRQEPQFAGARRPLGAVGKCPLSYPVQ
ncbi:hypothetical protein ABH917_003145 [Thermobifida halotolerans]